MRQGFQASAASFCFGSKGQSLTSDARYTGITPSGAGGAEASGEPLGPAFRLGGVRAGAQPFAGHLAALRFEAFEREHLERQGVGQPHGWNLTSAPRGAGRTGAFMGSSFRVSDGRWFLGTPCWTVFAICVLDGVLSWGSSNRR
jgi:hypothetical protein